MSIRLKTILGIAAIEAVLLCFLVWNALTFLRESNIGQLDKRAVAAANLFAAATKAGILSLDLATLESQVEVLVRDESVVYARVTSPTYGDLAQRGNVPDPDNEAAKDIRSAKAVIEEGGVVLGWVEVGLSDESIGQILKAARGNALAAGATGMLFSALFSAVLGYYLTRQLSKLTTASQEIAAGNFAHRIPVRGGDELATVARAFNHMSQELNQSYAQMEERIRLRTAELAQSNEELVREAAERRQAHRDISQILGAVPSMLIGLDAQGRVRRFNQAAEQTLGLRSEDVLGHELSMLKLLWEETKVAEALERCRQELAPVKAGPLSCTSAAGHEVFLLLSVSPLLGGGQHTALEGMLLLLEDITDVRLLESQLAQAQRLEAIGQLAAGIAHEINTPIQYVGDSATFLQNAFSDLLAVLAHYEGLCQSDSCRTPEAREVQFAALNKALRDLDYEFLKEEIPKSFVMIQEGITRVSTIVLAMRRFSHPGDDERKALDLNQAVETTLVVSRNEWKYVAEVATDLDPDLPLVHCLPGEINQVLLNVVVNAAHAIGDAVKGSERLGRITVRTRRDGDQVELSVTDTGTGIPEHARKRIFDPFFTTKEVGKGTGQGLTIAYDIVVNKHGGGISFETETGQGTTFFIRLPLGGEAA